MDSLSMFEVLGFARQGGIREVTPETRELLMAPPTGSSSPPHEGFWVSRISGKEGSNQPCETFTFLCARILLKRTQQAPQVLLRIIISGKMLCGVM